MYYLQDFNIFIIINIYIFDFTCSQTGCSHDANKLQVEIHKTFVNKASDWTIRKRDQSSNPVAQTI
jgi:hypothetical protein